MIHEVADADERGDKAHRHDQAVKCPQHGLAGHKSAVEPDGEHDAQGAAVAGQSTLPNLGNLA